MDRDWMYSQNRISPEYREKVNEFLNYSYRDKDISSLIYCPCKDCANRFYVNRNEAYSHLIVRGFTSRYRCWIYHGETSTPIQENTMATDNTQVHTNDSMVNMIHEAFGVPHGIDSGANTEHGSGPNEKTKDFFKLLEDAETELFPGCQNFSKLSFIVRLLQLKALSSWTNKSFTLLLGLLKEVFPELENIPGSYYEAKKIVDALGFNYHTWDSCPNNCMIYRGEDIDLEKCCICGENRYKEGGKKIGIKRVRYFPLKERLQKFFMSSKTASLMKWHVEGRSDDGVLRHPADSKAWKSFDENNKDFSNDKRNVRLGLSADGFNPFRTLSTSRSTWPVILIPYNLPPWLCMKQPFLILSMLIDGPNGPGDKIDVFLQPLIEELMLLWNEGVLTYDASANEMFTLHAALLWTINDFPAYANLSGYSTKGFLGCPCCEDKTKYLRLCNGMKTCYMGDRH
ncbi:unnamed protein product [Cuscuta epithymum]|uniref:Transposase-associated domain-containing protein n=1 Tax=Cuscuta epithymum TaxID=186058 RepID=A0AAV0D1E1_9ASTE|nr:unnamed protein product [Cuscuta epithymum]